MATLRALLLRLVLLPVVLPVALLLAFQAWYSPTNVSTRRHLGLDPGAPIEEFEGVASGHPVYRIVFADESIPQEVRP